MEGTSVEYCVNVSKLVEQCDPKAEPLGTVERRVENGVGRPGHIAKEARCRPLHRDEIVPAVARRSNRHIRVTEGGERSADGLTDDPGTIGADDCDARRAALKVAIEGRHEPRAEVAPELRQEPIDGESA